MLIKLITLVNKYKLKINGVFHIGAHHCEERKDYHEQGVTDEKIIWIEGNKQICDNVKKSNKNIIIYNEVVSDANNQELEFIITNNGQSSSILELDLHKKFHPHVHEVNRYKVKTKTVDTIIEENKINMQHINFLNIDIQGAELLALKGMTNNLKYFDYIYLEVNIDSVYKNCALMTDIDKFLLDFGFKRMETCLTEYKWGDAFYVKNK
jgi:FkbM family methyltransferase